MTPRIACPNFIDDIDELRGFVKDHGFDGVDWTFRPDNMPVSMSEESLFVSRIGELRPLPVRYHCFFNNSGFGDHDPVRRDAAMGEFRKALRIVSKVQGRSMTIHVGLSNDSSEDTSWTHVIESLRELVSEASERRIRICLENLAYGWTSRPNLFEKLVRKTNSWVTLDIGHAQASNHLISQAYDLEDFIAPHPERILNAHVYDKELSNGHSAPDCLDDVEQRLDALMPLPLCDWWTLELREEAPLLKMLAVTRQYFDAKLLTRAV